MKVGSRSGESRKNSSEKSKDNEGRHHGEMIHSKPAIWRHIKTRGLYRLVGSHIDKDRDEYCVRYREWNDFGESEGTLYSRSWATFKEKFVPYEYTRIEVVPTPGQVDKDLEWYARKQKRRK